MFFPNLHCDIDLTQHDRIGYFLDFVFESDQQGIFWYSFFSTIHHLQFHYKNKLSLLIMHNYLPDMVKINNTIFPLTGSLFTIIILPYFSDTASYSDCWVYHPVKQEASICFSMTGVCQLIAEVQNVCTMYGNTSAR